MKKHAGHFKPAGQEPRRGKGGRRPGAGAPSNERLRLRALAADLVAKELEKGLGSIVDAYLALATGLPVRRHRRKLDPATVRHAIERVLAQAPRKLILDAQETVEAFFEQVEKAAQEGEGEE